MSANKRNSDIVKNAIALLLILRVLLLGLEIDAKIQQGEFTPEDLAPATTELINLLQQARSLEDERKKK